MNESLGGLFENWITSASENLIAFVWYEHNNSSKTPFFISRKLLLKDLKMDVEGGGSDDLDRDIDLDTIDAGINNRKQIKDPGKVLEYWNSCFEKDTLTSLHFREWWRQRVPKFFSPIPSMNYQKPNDHIEEDDVKKYFFDDYVFIILQNKYSDGQSRFLALKYVAIFWIDRVHRAEFCLILRSVFFFSI